MVSCFLITVPPPTLNITSSTADNHFFPGLQLNLTCFIHLGSPLESTLSMSTSWSKSRVLLTTNEKILINRNPIELGSLLYQTTLVIKELDESDDNGYYLCRANIMSSKDRVIGALAEISKTVIVEGNFFIF